MNEDAGRTGRTPTPSYGDCGDDGWRHWRWLTTHGPAIAVPPFFLCFLPRRFCAITSEAVIPLNYKTREPDFAGNVRMSDASLHLHPQSHHPHQGSWNDHRTLFA